MNVHLILIESNNRIETLELMRRLHPFVVFVVVISFVWDTSSYVEPNLRTDISMGPRGLGPCM